MTKPRVENTLRLTVLGQALIQHDLRADPWPDFAALAEMFGRADACFTDLETAIRTPLVKTPTREDIFLHAAGPAVSDCLKGLSISLLATANNHIWDLGTGGITGALAELDARGFSHAGAGPNLAAAAAPAIGAPRRAPSGSSQLPAAPFETAPLRPLREPASMSATRFEDVIVVVS